MKCKLFGHKWDNWNPPMGEVLSWERYCMRRSCKCSQRGGYGKRPDYKNLKVWRVL